MICQYYYPEQFRITDICEELFKRGHRVTVITGTPNYPMGKIYDGYRFGQKRDEVINGVNVHRCFTVGRRKGAFYRFLNYYSFAISSTFFANRLKDEYDIVFVNQLSPVMMANAGISYKKKYNKRLVLYCLDLWPESLAAGGVKKGSSIYKYFLKLSKKIYKQADKIFVSSQSFSEYFKEKFNLTNTEYLPQYSEEIFNPDSCRKKPDGYVDLMFAGNVGSTQSVRTIIEAADLTKDLNNLRWHIVGDGSELEHIKKLSDDYELSSMYFYGRQPIEKMPEFYTMADAMLVTLQENDDLSLTLPGKVQTYLAAGKPIIGAINGETKLVINAAECGYCGSANNIEELAYNVRAFIKEKTDRETMGNNSRHFYDQNFRKEIFISKLESEFRLRVRE